MPLSMLLFPKIDNTISFITSELDEQDREEFFRLKKVQGKKKERQAAEEARVKAARASIGVTSTEHEAPTAATNILSQFEKDPDIMF
ncbi:hypothetical protein BASA81_009997 [Batrachochytrium salamandrivorans]|nr:hypothetical protein BASA81_009997 [Batrachochytrium salamandrivorans]